MRKLWTGDDVKKLVEDADYELIDVPNWDWVKSLDNIVVSCGEHEPYRVTRQSFKRGSRCRQCRTREARERYSLTHEEVVNRIKNMNIGLVVMKDSPIYMNNRTKLKLWCEKGEHYIFLSWEKIDGGRRCAKCSGIYNYSHSEIEEMVREIDNSYNVMKDSDRYENSVTKLKIYHEVCDSFFYMTWRKFKQGQRTCNCNPNSKYELRTSKVMQKYNIDHRKEIVFDNLESDNGVKLRYDFGVYENGELLFLIEVDGKQHFEKASFNSYENKDINFAKIQYHDKLKNDYAKRNEIPLFRIRYDEEIEEVVEKVLKEFNLIGDVEFE